MERGAGAKSGSRAGSGGRFALCPGQSNSHSLEDSGESSRLPIPALSQTSLFMQLLKAGMEGALAAHIHPKQLFRTGASPRMAPKHLGGRMETGMTAGSRDLLCHPGKGLSLPVGHTSAQHFPTRAQAGGEGGQCPADPPGQRPEVGHGHTRSWAWWCLTSWRICLQNPAVSGCLGSAGAPRGAPEVHSQPWKGHTSPCRAASPQLLHPTGIPGRREEQLRGAHRHF